MFTQRKCRNINGHMANAVSFRFVVKFACHRTPLWFPFLLLSCALYFPLILVVFLKKKKQAELFLLFLIALT